MELPAELLVYANDRQAVASLVTMLQDAGHSVDVACDVATAQGLFLERGGHALLVMAPNISPGEAQQVVTQLRAVDPELAVAVFGESNLRALGRDQVHRIRGFCPSSRAGIGAIQKLLCER